MGEQSASWAVDSTWTGQVEHHRARVDTANVADIFAQPGSTSDQRPSSPSDMPPSTRSQKTASSLAVTPNLDTLAEEIDKATLGGDSGNANSVPRAPIEKGLAEERRAGAEVRTKPKKKRFSQSVTSEQRKAARDADPNKARCLLTNRPSPVQLCHVIANAAEDETLTKLEYVWEIGYGKFDRHTEGNLMHLRADWHFLFDKLEWVLIPEAEVLRQLNQIYVKDRQRTWDPRKLFTEPTYNYYVLPTPALQEPICRFPDAHGQNHETHFPPFPNLGTVQSHVLPHFVVFNTGKKMDHLAHLRPIIVGELIEFLTQIVTPAHQAASMLVTLQRVYTAWVNVEVPDDYCVSPIGSNGSSSSYEAGQDGPSQGRPPRWEGRRSATRSQGQRSQVSGGRNAGGQQRATHPFQPSEDEESSVTDDTIVDDSTDWIDYIHNWRKQDNSATEKQESEAFNNSCDEQLAAYIKEHARTPPSPGAWDSWRFDWDDSKSRHPIASDRSRFSSNDWAVFKNDVYLTRPNYPQATVRHLP